MGKKLKVQSKQEVMDETLIKVEHDFLFALDGLREANKYGTATESIILLKMIKAVADVRSDFISLQNARAVDREVD